MEFNNAEADRVKVCLIGNSKLSKMVHSLIPEFQSIAEILIIDSIFHDALLSAKRLVEHDAVDVFVSAGANAHYLKDTLPVPVVPLELRQSDLVNGVLKARQISKTILLLTYEHQSTWTEFLNYVEGAEIVHRTYQTAEEAREIFHSVEKTGIGVVIGSSFICDLAEQEGLPFVMVYTRESCRHMIQKAISVAGQHKREGERRAFVQFLIDNSASPTIVTNRDEQVIGFNKSALQLIKGLMRNKRVDRFLDARFLQTPETVAERISIGDRLCRVQKSAFELQGVRVGHLYTVNPAPQRSLDVNGQSSGLVYKSDRMSEVVHFLQIYGATLGSVLLRGETGTGKELAARTIHESSANKDGPFVAINCAAIPSELFESELFGYADGAFTSSRSGGKSGLLETANNGTFFMDEINSLPMPQQAKLLRVLQERNVRPIGSRRSVDLNIKFVAACNHDLREEVKAGRFREDLYYRLTVFIIDLPPLRDRPDDLEPLTRYFIYALSKRYGIEVDISELIRILVPYFKNYSWPGNVRQLENLMERLLVSSSLYESMTQFAAHVPTLAPELFEHELRTPAMSDGHLQAVEYDEILKALERFDGNKTKAAEYLGVSQTTLWRRLKRLKG